MAGRLYTGPGVLGPRRQLSPPWTRRLPPSPLPSLDMEGSELALDIPRGSRSPEVGEQGMQSGRQARRTRKRSVTNFRAALSCRRAIHRGIWGAGLVVGAELNEWPRSGPLPDLIARPIRLSFALSRRLPGRHWVGHGCGRRLKVWGRRSLWGQSGVLFYLMHAPPFPPSTSAPALSSASATLRRKLPLQHLPSNKVVG